MPENVIVRPFGSEDSIQELTMFLHAAYARLAEAGMRFLASHQDAETTLRRIREGECLVAFLGERMAGTITFHDSLHTRGCDWYDRSDVASFHQLAVAAHLRGRGIGSLLIGAVETRAAETGADEIACDTAENAFHLIRLYESRGYRSVGRADWRPTTNYRSVVLSKRLGRKVDWRRAPSSWRS